MGKWRPNTNNSIIQIRKISTLLSVTSLLLRVKNDLCGYVEVNRPLSNEELLVSSDTPSLKRIQYE